MQENLRDIINHKPFQANTVYVIGHRNPDNDAVCSSIGLACLRNMLEQTDIYRPCCIESTSPQTQFVLENYFSEPSTPYATKPSIVSNLSFRVKDAMQPDVLTLEHDVFLKEALEFLMVKDLITAPVVKGRKFLGLFSLRSKKSPYFVRLNVEHLLGFLLSIEDILARFEANLLVPTSNVDVEIGSKICIDPGHDDFLQPSDDVVISGASDNRLLQIIAKMRPRILIVAQRGPPPNDMVLKEAEKKGVGLIDLPYSIFSTCDLLMGSVRIEHLIDKQWTTLYAEDFLEDVRDQIKNSRYPMPVLDSDCEIAGIISHKDIIAPKRKPIILVDHSEISQAVEGIEDCEIKQIVDHHRLGNVETDYPIDIFARPVGSSSTLVAMKFKEHELTPPQDVAAVMLSSILSDTLILSSPTTTSDDRDMADWLSELSNLEIEEFGLAVLEKNDLFARFTKKTIDVNELINHDFKKFKIKNIAFGISQVETVCPKLVTPYPGQLQTALNQTENGKIVFAILMVTDVLKKNTYLFRSNNGKPYVDPLFGEPQNTYVLLENIVSRKLQIVPQLLKFIRLSLP